MLLARLRVAPGRSTVGQQRGLTPGDPVEIMLGDALVLEHERLNQRMNHFFDKVELHLKDILYPHASAIGHATPTVQAQVQAQALTAFAIGQIHRFVRSGFRRKASERASEALALLLA